MLNPNLVLKNLLQHTGLNGTVSLIARVLLAYLFVVAGWGKISGYAGTVAYMDAMGVPSGLLPLVILLELGGGLALILGLQTRVVALALAIFSLISAVIFHAGPEDAINYMKNFAMAGGFLFVMLQGAGKFSLDHALEK